MAQVPSNLIPTRLSQLPEDPAPSGDGWLMYVRDGVTYKTQASTLLDVSGVPPTRAVIAGTGLTGGGALSSDVTLSVAPHGIGSSELSNTGVSAGVYGSATSTGQLTVGEDGRVTSAVEVTSTPDMAQATGVLGLTNGGSGRSLVATPGAFVYTDGGGMQVMPQGVAGQVPVSTANGAPIWGTVVVQTPQPANVVYAGPESGPDALTAFRSLVNADLPVVDVAHGGTNATTAADARASLSAAVLGANGDITSLTGITGGVGTASYVVFDTTPTGVPTSTPGTLFWDSADGNLTLSLVMGNGTTTQQIGEEQFFRIKATATVTNGQVVMFTGSVGASGGLTGAPATGLTADTALYVMGVATEDIAMNGWGYVTSFGLVRKINTTGGAEAWVDGQLLYLDPTVPGGLTKVLPTAPNPKVVVAAVTHAASNGSLFIRPAFGGRLGDFEGDVNLAGLANGQLLVRDETAGVWKNATLTDGTGVSVTEGAGSVTVGLATAYGDSLNPYASKTANYFLAAPNGSTGVPSFRAVVAADIPTLNQNTTGTSANVTGTVNVVNGGTGRVTGTTAYALVATGTTATGAQQSLAAGATTEVLVGGGAAALPVWTTATGSGAPVRAISPTLVTPALGIPSALVGTNITGTAAGLTAGTVTTNANLTGDVTSVGNATTLTNAPVIAKVLTGYVSGAGTVVATDSILQAIQKLNGNDATNANLTGMVTSVGNATTVVTNANLTGDVTSVGNATTLTNAPVIAKVLTGYVSGAGTVAATDSILQAIQKLNGNDATNANLTGPITSVGNATSVASQTGTGSTFVMNTSPTLVTPLLGTPTSGTLTNCTGLPIAGGGTGASTAPGARTNLGATTVGANVFTLTNPSAVTFPRFNADNTVSALDAATFRTAIGATGTGTVTSVAALTLGTTGTDLSSTVANSTTTPVITLNVPTASAANRGALSSANWTTFNNKQAALVSGTNIKTVGGVSLLGAGDVGTLGTAYGGTNSTATPAAGGVAYGSGSAILVTAAGTAGQVLTSTGAGAPAWGGISGGTF